MRSTMNRTSISQVSVLTTNRSLWRASIRKGTARLETDRITQAKQKDQQWKDRLLHPPDSSTAATNPYVPFHIPRTNWTYQSSMGSQQMMSCCHHRH